MTAYSKEAYCKECGKLFEREDGREPWPRFCSHECRMANVEKRRLLREKAAKTIPTITVRKATPSDVAALKTLVPQILAESEVLALSSDKIEELVIRCCERRDGSIAGVIDGDRGAVNASIGMTFTESLVSDEQYIAVVWCGIAPAVRRLSEETKPHENDPRRHYSRTLFDFARWAHDGLERAAGHRIIMRWDVLTLEDLMPKMGLFSRQVPQVGAYFALGARGTFKPQVEEPAA